MKSMLSVRRVVVVGIFLVSLFGVAVLVVTGKASSFFTKTISTKEQQAFTKETVKDTSDTLNASKQEDNTVTLLFGGDVMLSRAIGELMEKQNNWSYPFMHIASTLKDADITFVNLEGPIALSGTKKGSIYSFRANPKSIEGLVASGVDVVSIANNHMWDYGREAFLETLAHLDTAGIVYTGGGHTFKDAHTEKVFRIGTTTIAYLAYTPLLPTFLGAGSATPAVAFPTKEQLQEDIERAKGTVDVVVVSVHFGTEYKMTHDAYQEKLAHEIIDYGADLVIGHHPHVVEDIEMYKGKYIVYSLGNLVFDQNFSKETSRGLLVKVYIKNGHVSALDQIPVVFTKTYQPKVDNSP